MNVCFFVYIQLRMELLPSFGYHIDHGANIRSDYHKRRIPLHVACEKLADIVLHNNIEEKHQD